MKEFLIALLSIPFYPLIFPFKVFFEPNASIAKKIFTVIFAYLVLLPLWISGFISITFSSWVVLQWVGVIRMEVPVTGASMLPTFDENGYVAFYRRQRVDQLEPTFARGDIVVFQNEKTEKEFQSQNKSRGGFVKRIVGMPGDVVLIRDGFVYVNGELIEEPYILQPRSTFGGKNITDCKVITVPEKKYLVLGDNRKLSMDSRDIGLINDNDIEFYLTLLYEKEFFYNFFFGSIKVMIH